MSLRENKCLLETINVGMYIRRSQIFKKIVNYACVIIHERSKIYENNS